MSAWIQRAFSSGAGAGPPSISPATAGNLLLIVGSRRSGSMNLSGAGWTLITSRHYGDYVEAWKKTAVGGETTVGGLGMDCQAMLAEYPAGAVVRDFDDTADTSLSPSLNPSLTLGSVVENDHVVAVIGCGLADGAFDSAASGVSYTPGAGWTEHFDDNSSSGHPVTWIADQDAPASVPITASATIVPAPGLTNPVYYIWGMVMVAVSGEAPPPPEPGIVLSIGEVDITDALEKSIRVEADGTGNGSFKISRHSAQATAANLAQGNLVKVTIPRVDPDPIFAFFLESGDFTLVSTDEEGGELLSFGGRGARSLLARAIMWDRSYASTTKAILPPSHRWIYTKSGGQIASRESVAFASVTTYDVDLIETLAWPGHGDKYASRDYGRLSSGPHSGKYVHVSWLATPYAGVGEWKLWAFGDKPGQILHKIITEAQEVGRPQHPLAAMTFDFDASTDSNGDAWASSDATALFTVQIGENLDDITQRLIDTGDIDVVMDPDLVLHAYNHYGRDLHGSFATDTVRFERGVNIADVLTRSQAPELPATHILVDGDDDIVATAQLPDAGSRYTVEVYASVEGSDVTALEDAGASILAEGVNRLESAQFNIAPDMIDYRPEEGLYLPGPDWTDHGNFWVGDSVSLSTGSTDIDYVNRTVDIAAITIAADDATNLIVTPEIVGIFHDYRRPDTLRFGRYQGGTINGSTQDRGVLPGRTLAKRSTTEDASTGGATSIPGVDLDVTAADVTYDNGTSGLSATDVQAALDELATGAGLDALNAAVFGYQAHGNLGSTETFDSTAAGWHSGTLNADCTFTFTAQASGTVSTMVLELTQDGTGGWDITLPGSVVGDFSGYDTTAGTTSLLMFFTRDGGTTWFGFIAGGGSTVVALDDLSDVTITSPATADRLRYDGSVWRNSALRWKGLTVYDGTYWLPLVDGDGNLIDAEA